MDNFDAHKWFKKEYLGEGHTDDDKVVAKGDGIEITKKQMERLQKGYSVRLSNGSVLASPFVKEGHTEDKMERDMETRKRSKLSPDELKKVDAMRAFYRGETDVLPADLKEDTEREVYDDIIKLIKSETMKYGSSEIDEAMDVMEFIGQHYGINFEFGRG